MDFINDYFVDKNWFEIGGVIFGVLYLIFGIGLMINEAGGMKFGKNRMLRGAIELIIVYSIFIVPFIIIDLSVYIVDNILPSTVLGDYKWYQKEKLLNIFTKNGLSRLLLVGLILYPSLKYFFKFWRKINDNWEEKEEKRNQINIHD